MSKNHTFPKGWHRGPLSTLIARLESGVSVNSDGNEGGSAEFSILKTSCVNGGRFNPAECKSILPEEVRRAELNPRIDSILISRMNTFALVGESAYVDQDCPNVFIPDRLWQTVMRVDICPNVRWLSYVLQSPDFRFHVSNAATGTSGSMKNISQPSFLGIAISIPPSKEQRKIARILTTVDNLIEQTEALIEKYKSIKQGMMHDLFTRGVDSNGQLRPPYKDAPHLYKQSPLGWIPNEWEPRLLQEIVCSDSPITYGVVQPGPEDPSGVLFIRGGDIFDSVINTQQLRTISKKVSDGYRRTLLHGGELVVSLVGYPGEVAIVPEVLAGANIARQAALIRLSNEYNAEFVSNYLLSTVGKEELFRNAVGSAQQVINLADLKYTRVSIPPVPEQEIIAESIIGLRRKLQGEENNLRKFNKIKSGLMQDLLTGKVRVKVDEAEEVTADV